MEPLPYTDSAAKVVFYVLVLGFVALELRTRLRSLTAEDAPIERLSLLVIGASLGVGLIAALLAAALLQSAAIAFARWPVFLLGALTMAAGIALRQWAIAVLGSSFTVEVRVRPEQRVIEAGPYRHLAHPSYTGLVLSLVGLGLMLGNWISILALAVLPTLGLVYRIRVEERALLAGLGEPYRRFLQGRRRLLPGVW
ncbi:MAG TPA: isoprenylcysteine carboxylmethyltransferase family protein [Solirubrobacterales bacterium]|jgi:protein-S-isoprenylcysteine O-methyltransferase Ste14